MKNYKTEFLDMRLGDCMQLMGQYPDNHFDLAIVDPPYGIGGNKRIGKRSGRRSPEWGGGDWDTATPSKEYFDELRRVSKNQIIWGGNYFDLPPTRCFLVWDKGTRISFADCEMAWTSFNKSACVFHWHNNKTIGAANPNRFHPTEKPVALYDWILSKFTTTGMKILDTHLGSGTNAIACHNAGLHLTAFEMDEYYFSKAVTKIKTETKKNELS